MWGRVEVNLPEVAAYAWFAVPRHPPLDGTAKLPLLGS